MSKAASKSKSSRQNNGDDLRSHEGAAAPRGKAAKKRGWPILEVVLILLLAKISVGAFFILSDSDLKTSSPSPVELSQRAAELLDPSNSEEAISKPTPGPSQSLTAAADVDQKASLAAAKPEAEGTEQSSLKPSKVDEYLAAAAVAVRPSVAEARGPVAAVVTEASNYSAVSAGALFVVGGQSGASGTQPMPSGVRAESIPLPPGSDDLLTPAAQLPAPSLPALSNTPSNLPAAEAPLDSADLASLRAREQDLARKAALLATKEEALVSLEGELNKQLATIEASRLEIETMVKRNEAIVAEMQALREQQKTEEDEMRAARIQHLVTAYGGMKPDQAGLLVNSLDEVTAVQILASMPGRKAGQILAFVDPEKAARLTKAISEMRIDPNLLMEDQSAQ